LVRLQPQRVPQLLLALRELQARLERLVVLAAQPEVQVEPVVELAAALVAKQVKKVAPKAAQKAMQAEKARATAAVKGKDIAANMKAAKKKPLTALKCTISESVSSARALAIAL
jgi:hypothetical protein